MYGFGTASQMAPYGYSQQVSNAQRQRVLAEHLKTAAGRHRIAASLTQPLRLRRDYTSVVRKTFEVEDLPDGALPIYDKDPEVTAFVVGEEGDNILAMQKSRRVIFPLFEAASNPEIPLSQLKERRFDLVERCQDLAKAQIQAIEDERGFAIMDSLAVSGFDTLPGGTNPDVSVLAPITPSVMADAFAEVERHDLRVARVFMNATDYADVRKWGRDVLDMESQKVLLNTGLQATLWGAQIITSRLIPVGYVYVCCEPINFGRIPVRTELTVISADDPRTRTIGFSVFQQIGIGAFNPKGEARVVVSRF